MKVAIHIDLEHACGHMHETIFHVQDAIIEGCINAEYPEWPASRSGEFTAHIDHEMENRVELIGSLGGIEITTCPRYMSRRERIRQWVIRLLSAKRYRMP